MVDHDQADLQIQDRDDKGCKDDEGNECDPMAEFTEILASIKLDLLPKFASSVRRSNKNTRGKDSAEEHSTISSIFTCKVTFPPFSGTNNIAFPISFDDGTRWILKVPRVGHQSGWCDEYGRELENEARTMQFLRRKSSIPIPEVYLFDGSLDNELNCPYILMEYIDGIQACEVWNDKVERGTSLEKRRTRILEEIAAAMVQLNDFAYNQAGSLEFNEEGNPVGVEAITVDFAFDPVFNKIYLSEMGPFTDVKSYLCRFADHNQAPGSNTCNGKPMVLFEKGAHELLRLFLDWIPAVPHKQRLDFVLTHPDFNFQNILVTEEGKLLALIDWQRVRAVPRCIGCESYPRWLTRDWNLSACTSNQIGCSQEELSHYRTLYRQFIKKSLAEKKRADQSRISCAELGSENELLKADLQPYPSITHNSLVLSNLIEAADNPGYLIVHLMFIFEKIAKVTAAEWEPKSETTAERDILTNRQKASIGKDDMTDNITMSFLDKDGVTKGFKDPLLEQIGDDDQIIEKGYTSDIIEDENSADEDDWETVGDEAEGEVEMFSTSSSDPKTWVGSRQKFEYREVAEALGNNMLDEDRMKRLKQGFLSFLA